MNDREARLRRGHFRFGVLNSKEKEELEKAKNSKTCPTCEGEGSKGGTKGRPGMTCPECGGSGKAENSIPCPKCQEKFDDDWQGEMKREDHIIKAHGEKAAKGLE
jgi:RecJ-like exonuclease